MSAAASLGMLLLWDVDGGLSQIDAYMMSDKEDVKAGALLAIGIVNSTVRNEHEPALALLQDYTSSKVLVLAVGSIMGLGLAYAGTCNEEATELIAAVLYDCDKSNSLELYATAAIAMGQIHVGSGNEYAAEAIIHSIMSLLPLDQNSHYTCMFALGLAFIFLGQQENSEIAYRVLDVGIDSESDVFSTIIETIAYAGSGNVLKIQKLLHKCSEYIDDKEDNKSSLLSQSFATVGIAIVAMGEEIGVEMALRTMNHLLQYGEPVIRSKLTHDPDKEVAHNSIFALGIMGAGTNHARIAGMLRHLAQYYSRSKDALFVVRVAQGLLYTGKGSISISPFHTERTLMSPAATAGLLTTMLSMLHVKEVLLGDLHYMLYHLALAMHPRILSLFDENLKPLSLTVRVGQAVDVVGQAGFGERAQLASDEYEPLTPMLEGFVICRKITDQNTSKHTKTK
eukprot:gene10764-2851_t